jgi:hypothetical protein
MDRQEADRALAGLGAAHDRIAAAMYAVDSHPGLAFLRSGTLAGETAARWQALRPEIDLLWAAFALFGDLLERARGARSRRGDPELDRLLGDPVVVLDPTGLPVEAPAGAGRLRLWDLAQQLEARCATAVHHLSEVDGSWSAVAGRLTPLTETLDGLARTAGDLGLPDALRDVDTRLATARTGYLADPLTAAPNGRPAPGTEATLREVAARLDAERDRLAGLVRVRDGYPERAAQVRGLIDEVEAAERGTADGYARATRKIANPGLPPLPGAAPVLRARLEELDEVRRQRDWARLADGLAAVEDAARRARQRAAELREVADGLLDRRDELRGRLDAYQAKASGTGFAEDEELTDRYRRAHDLLFTAPCDLPASTRAVYEYQRAVSERSVHD